MPLAGATLSGPAKFNDVFASSLAERPDETALVSATKTRTWRELERDINLYATNLIAMGLRPGDRIASLMPNRCDLLVHYLACLNAGLVVTPLNYRYTATEIDYALQVSGASILLAHAERTDDIQESKLTKNLPFGLISYGGSLDDAERFEDLMKRERPNVCYPAPDFEAPAFIFFTSGSTGKPKGVTHSLLSFGSIVASFAQAMSLTVQDVVFPGSSFAHVGALTTSLAGFHAGAKVVVARSFDGDEILTLLRKYRPSVLVMLPSALITLERDHNATGEDFTSLRLCITGGDKFPAGAAKEFTELTGLGINETYGLTEATDSLFNPSNLNSKAGSVGTVCPGYMASIRDADGQEVPENIVGNLWLGGAPVMIGYWRNSEATNNVVVGGWFDTGDLMRVDSDGFFWFHGRKKQTIVHDGSNISPQEIEEAVMSHPAIDLAGVVGVHDDVHGENVWAYVTLKMGIDPPRSLDVIRFAREKVGYKAPEVVKFLDTMPMNATGKVDRLALKKLAAKEISASHVN